MGSDAARNGVRRRASGGVGVLVWGTYPGQWVVGLVSLGAAVAFAAVAAALCFGR
jgi:hypothetical protein